MTETPNMLTGTPNLDEALSRLRLDGSIFFRAEFSEAWEYESMDGAATAALLRPGARSVILFHLVAKGRCWVSLPGGERHWAGEGDVIVIPYSDLHIMGGRDRAEMVELRTLFEPPPWTQMPVVRYGRGGDRTDLVCGYLHGDDVLFDPLLQALPSVFVVRPPAGPMADWVRASIAFAMNSGAAEPDSVGARLPELLLREVLRVHLAGAPAGESGWLAALRDPVLGPAMARLHADPRRKWTVADLAGRAVRVTLGAGRTVPKSTGPSTDSLSHRLAPAPCGRVARRHVRHRLPGCPQGRLRLGGSIQPFLQTGKRPLAQRVAGCAGLSSFAVPTAVITIEWLRFRQFSRPSARDQRGDARLVVVEVSGGRPQAAWLSDSTPFVAKLPAR